MRKVGVEVRNGQDNQQKSFGKVFKSVILLHIYFQESGSSQFWYQKKKEYLANYLTPSLVIDREGKGRKKHKTKQGKPTIDTLEGNAHKDLAEDKGDKVELGFTFHYCVNKS